MALSYRFKKFKLDDGTYTKRPIVDVILKNNDKYLEFGAILDSGSDITTIPKAAADSLELNIDDKEVEHFKITFNDTQNINLTRLPHP